MSFKDPLPSGISLQIFNNETLIFESSGKWLHPLFDFDKFLETYDGPKDNLCLHDTVIGKAAAVLAIRFGIKKINADILSEIAKNYIEEINSASDENHKIEYAWTNIVPKIICATEDELKDLHDNEKMYHMLRKRAKLE